ncbi:MAG: hypothetical protein P8Y44_02480 [Acidobacteriota bacterium]
MLLTFGSCGLRLPTTAVAAACLAILSTSATAMKVRQDPEPTGDEVQVLGKRSAIRSEEQAHEWVRIEGGTEIYEQPSTTSTLMEIVAEPTDLEILELQDGWVKIQYRGWLGWAALEPTDEDRATSIPVTYTADDDRLDRARAILGLEIEASRLGPFELFTDVGDPELLAQLSNVATHLSDAYQQRFGLDPGSEASEVVVIFASKADYLLFEAGEPDIAGTGTRGYTGRGISVLSVGERDPASTVGILIHELTHLLNRRVFGLRSPAWIEEGLAEDLAYCKVDSNGKLQLGSLAGSSRREISTSLSGRYRIDTEITGGYGMLSNLLDHWGDPLRPPLTELVDMPWIEFIQPEVRPLHYAQSGFFVRYVLSSRSPNHASSFLDFLQALSSSTMPQVESVWSYLNEDPDKVEAAYFRWLRRTAAANGL